jgi:hypothetical protein
LRAGTLRRLTFRRPLCAAFAIRNDLLTFSTEKVGSLVGRGRRASQRDSED